MRRGPRRVVITDGHEAEAKAARLRKPPNPIGLFFIRLLGFRGEVPAAAAKRTRAGPSHERPVRRKRPTAGK